MREVNHQGSPPAIEMYLQETDRGGRDGLPATATMHNVPGVKSIDETMKKYISNQLECRRKLLMEHFDEVHESDYEQSCKCCGDCEHTCTCCNCYHR